MRKLLRATAVAVACLSLATGTGFAEPLVSERADAAPVTTRSLAYVAGQPGIALAVNTVSIDIRTPLADSALSAPAIATAATDHQDDAIVAAAVVPAQLRSLGELVKAHASTEVADSEHDCLAGAVYFESKGEPLVGQLAVAEVIMNRAKSGRFASSMCGVVKQRGQFSFIRGGRFPSIPRMSSQWREAVGVAKVALQELAQSTAPKALFFHARRVSPGWKLKRVATVGNHVFYR